MHETRICILLGSIAQQLVTIRSHISKPHGYKNETAHIHTCKCTAINARKYVQSWQRNIHRQYCRVASTRKDMDTTIKALQRDKISLLCYETHTMMMGNGENWEQMTKPQGLLNRVHEPQRLWKVTSLSFPSATIYVPASLTSRVA